MSATHPAPVAVPGSARAAGVSSVPAAWRATTVTRRLQLALGIIWLIDAALQYQPYMFSRSFVTNTIEPTARGAPWIVAQPTLWAAHLMIHHVSLYNSFFATIQLFVALALFYRPLVRFALMASVVWGFAVWWLAEGIGGIFNNASPLMGAPGAALLYVFIALVVWPRNEDDLPAGVSVAEGGALGATISKVLWAVLWLGFALLGLERANRSPSAIHDMVLGMESGEPSWIKAMDRGLAAVAANHGTELSIALSIVFVVTGLSVFGRRTAKSAVVLGALVGALIWLVENFGTIAVGSGTDVNSGLPLILLAACFWPLATARRTR